MKKLISIFLILIFFNLHIHPLQAQTLQIQIKDSIKLDSDITNQAVYAPFTLQTWEPPKDYTPVNSTGGAVSSSAAASGIGMAPIIAMATSIPVVLGGSLLTIFLARKNKHLLLPPLASATNTNMNPLSMQPDVYNFDYNEKVTYNILLENSKQTPLYPDSILYIKIPEWLVYEPNTTTINEKLMTDKNDKDFLTYLPKESVIIVHAGKALNTDSLAISFVVRVLKTEVNTNESFCLVKIMCPSKKYETEWQSVSSLGNQPADNQANTPVSSQ